MSSLTRSGSLLATPKRILAENQPRSIPRSVSQEHCHARRNTHSSTHSTKPAGRLDSHTRGSSLYHDRRDEVYRSRFACCVRRTTRGCGSPATACQHVVRASSGDRLRDAAIAGAVHSNRRHICDRSHGHCDLRSPGCTRSWTLPAATPGADHSRNRDRHVPIPIALGKWVIELRPPCNTRNTTACFLGRARSEIRVSQCRPQSSCVCHASPSPTMPAARPSDSHDRRESCSPLRNE